MLSIMVMIEIFLPLLGILIITIDLVMIDFCYYLLLFNNCNIYLIYLIVSESTNEVVGEMNLKPPPPKNSYDEYNGY